MQQTEISFLSGYIACSTSNVSILPVTSCICILMYTFLRMCLVLVRKLNKSGFHVSHTAKPTPAPAIPKEYLGMLEYKRDDETKLIQNIILGIQDFCILFILYSFYFCMCFCLDGASESTVNNKCETRSILPQT